jgi:hypothetical protein
MVDAPSRRILVNRVQIEQLIERLQTEIGDEACRGCAVATRPSRSSTRITCES